MNILNKIVESTKIRVNDILQSEKEIKEKAKLINIEPFLFEKSLKQRDISFICEIKKASPSKGIIAQNFPYLQIAKEYESAGANAISVLTEPNFFMGSTQYLEEISQSVKIPIIRKDFIIDELQIYEAKSIGASAILLICAILDDKKLSDYIKIADDLGLSCLVEAHDERETEMALNSKARIIGVNNRDLKTFQVDIRNSINLRKLVPEDIIFVSESGIENPQQIKELRENNVNAVLIGETFMRNPNKAQMLKYLKGEINEN